ncbi:MAG: alpha-ketoglutarate-dependent dioxygenase AlkB [Candidatus Rokubacteria bacterium 13_1_40CM_68_15]|nr:MAG: alpha-ketoglutarate-dependent dioxygenase AlkB [Candidatus Rokubacteria bacterium 13_1_40CM_68_15]
MTATAPAGFDYRPEFLTTAEEWALAEDIRRLEFGEVRMHGVAARRRTAHFGWRYGYESWKIDPGPPLPEFLSPLRDRAAALVALDSEEFAEALVTEYPAGAGIGWHRDALQFGPVVVGVSLLGACRFRFQRGQGTARETYALSVEPRSAYVLGGAARSAWQHAISPTKTLRYSVTFRTLRRYSAAG